MNSEETNERMRGLIKISDHTSIYEAAVSIKTDLADEGFEADEINEFLSDITEDTEAKKAPTEERAEVIEQVHKGSDYELTTYGENFYGKVEYRNEAPTSYRDSRQEISGASFRFRNTKEAKQFVANLQAAIKKMDSEPAMKERSHHVCY